MDPFTNSPLSDIFDNALDIFPTDDDLNSVFLPLLVEEPSQAQMPLLLEAIYTFAIEAKESIQSWAAQHGYAFVKRRCIKLSGGRVKYNWDCDRHGEPPSLDSQHHTRQPRIRNSSSRKTGCKCSISVIEVNATSWEVRKRPGLEYQVHNHPPSQSAWSHSAHRHFGTQEINKLRELHDSGKII